jgi:tetratricopeptide (TPR) repeat protein
MILIVGIILGCKSYQPKDQIFGQNENKLFVSSDEKSLSQLNQYPLFKQHLQNELASSTDDENILRQMHLAFILGKDAELKKITEKIILDQTHREEAFLILAADAIRKSKLSLAEGYLKIVNDRKYNSEKLNLEAMIYAKQEKYPQAIGNLKKVLEREPNDYAAAMNLGILYLDLRIFKLADEQFERLAKLYPESYDVKLHLAITKKSQGDDARALPLLEELEDIFPDNGLVKGHLNHLRNRS